MVRIIFVFVLLLSTTLVLGQKGEWHAGIEGGAGKAIISSGFISGLGYETEPGMISGVGIRKSITKHFSVSSGLDYEERKASLEIEERDDLNAVISISSIGIDISYLTLPVLLRFSLGNKLQGFVNTGCGVEYLTHEKTTTTGPIFETISIKGIDSEKKWLLIGFMYGAGVRLQLSKHISTSLEMRNNAGIFTTGGAFGANQIGLNSVNFILGLHYQWKCKNEKSNSVSNQSKIK